MIDNANSIPVNKTAGLVISKGFEYKSNKKILEIESQTPISTRILPKNAVDLTGVKFARFVVLGISLEHKGRWVVRCSCGTYTLRRSKAILNNKNIQDRCQECRHLSFLKRDEYRRRTGKDKDINLF